MIKMFSRHISNYIIVENEQKLIKNSKEYFDYLLKNYYIAPLNSEIFDEQYENICKNS